MAPLEYYFMNKDGLKHIVFNNYTIENGVITNTKGLKMSYTKNKDGYNRCSVTDDNGKRRSILVARAIASSSIGPPPTTKHTADHIDRNSANDIDDNVRWSCLSGQNKNRNIPNTFKTAFIVVKNEVEKTIDEWVEILKDERTPRGREYNKNVITQYAQKKKCGFFYKEYSDLDGEIWKEITCSKNKMGQWKISNMNRVKYVTKHAENVLSGDRLGLRGGYPRIKINGKEWYCHILSFMTFSPEEYANKKPDEIVLHEDDDKMDFRPHKLRIGTSSENCIDAHNNGKHYGTKSSRMKCASYIEGEFEKEHESQSFAIRYLKTLGYEKASSTNISAVLIGNGKQKTAYGRTWEIV